MLRLWLLAERVVGFEPTMLSRLLGKQVVYH